MMKEQDHSLRNLVIGTIIALSVGFSATFGSMYWFGDLQTRESVDNIKNTILEQTSCEKMFNVKNNLKDLDIMFYDESKVIEQAERKWIAMNCDDNNSEYWRGVNWDWTDSVENKIKEFGQ